MTRDEFEATVRKMQSENVPLTMANLMVRTELPRATIEDWLDGMQRDAKPARERAAKPADESGGKRAVRERSDDGDIVARARALRSEVLGDVMKSQLGLDGSTKTEARAKRGLATGGIAGLVLPPAGLFYAAPIGEAVAGTAAYVLLVYLLHFIPVFGSTLIMILHLLGGLAGFAYAWRFNRKGRRETLLPQRSGGRDGDRD